MMRILLLKPPSNPHLVLPPLGIAYLASSCCEKYDVNVLDCIKEKYTHSMFKEFITKEKPDILGVSALSMEIQSGIKCCDIAKEVDKNIITIVGGVHASNRPKELLNNTSIDYILVGECEETLPLLLEKIEKSENISDIPGLGFRDVKNKKIIINQPRLVDDLDKLKFPNWDLIKLDEYPHTYQSRRHPSAPIITSRGCPFLCTYCSGHTVTGRKWRPRSPENVVDEIKVLYNNYNVKEISIFDDNFTFDKERVKKICNLLIKENMDLIWNLPNGVMLTTLDEDLLKLMKKAGCYEVCIGIESCSNKILKDMKREFLNLNIIKEKAPLISKTGIIATGFFILGYPTETIEDIKETIKMSRNLGLDRARYLLFQALPGSEIFQELVKKKIISEDSIEWDKIYYSRANVLPYTIKDKKVLEKLQRNAIFWFYLRPKIFVNYVLDNMRKDQIKVNLHMAKLYVLHKYKDNKFDV